MEKHDTTGEPFILFCVDTNNQENCSLKVEGKQRNNKSEAAIIFILMGYYGWFLGKPSFWKRLQYLKVNFGS